jgi:hypothetical protein
VKLGVGARATAMGEAYTAEAGSVEALYWNPAGLVNAWRPAMMFSYKPIVEDTAQSQAAMAFKYKGIGYGVGYNGVQYQSIPSYDDVGNRLGDYDASDHLGIAAVAIGNDKLSAGIAAKYMRSTIATKSADAWAADAGVLAANKLFPSLSHAVVIKNIGSGLTFFEQEDALPLSVVLGNAMKFGGRFTATADLTWRSKEKTGVAGGLEWMVAGDRFRGFALRGGYTTSRNEIDGLSGASVGAGFAVGTVAIDYAWIPYGELGSSHAVSLIWNLPNIKWPKKKK